MRNWNGFILAFRILTLIKHLRQTTYLRLTVYTFVFPSGNSTAPKVAETLNQVALPVVPYDTCKRMDYWWFQVKESMICCGYTLPDELKSVCQVCIHARICRNCSITLQSHIFIYLFISKNSVKHLSVPQRTGC